MAQDEGVAEPTLPHQGWSLQSLHNQRLVLFSTIFQKFLNLGNFLNSIAINIWLFRVLWYLPLFTVLKIFLFLGTCKLSFFSPFQKKVCFYCTYRNNTCLLWKSQHRNVVLKRWKIPLPSHMWCICNYANSLYTSTNIYSLMCADIHAFT